MLCCLPKIFTGEAVTIVGGGPSLEGFNWTRLRGNIIGTNHSMRYHRGVILVAIDQVFHKDYGDYLDGLRCVKVTYNDTHRDDFVRVVMEPDHETLNEDWHVLKANLSGFLALALALHLGARRVFLLGFDGGYNDGQNNNFHSYKSGPAPSRGDYRNELFEYYSGRDVINVGTASRITAFKRVPIESEFYEIP